MIYHGVNFRYESTMAVREILDGIVFRRAHISEWDTCMELAWRTFLKYEASDYTEEGIENFREFVTEDKLKEMFLNGEYRLFVAEYGSRIIGMGSLREKSHISLLFVESRYHYMGVGRGLIDTLADSVRTDTGDTVMTVNAAPYALGFYHRVGFADTDTEQDTDGIRYTPMVLKL